MPPGRGGSTGLKVAAVAVVAQAVLGMARNLAPDFAYAACGPQIFILRVSGIRNRLSTKHTAGTAIG